MVGFIVPKVTRYARDLLALSGLSDLLSTIGSASTTAQGVVELATDAEANAASDTGRALTPSNLAALTGANLTSLSASTTARGIVEYATDTEANNAASGVRVLTPANLAALTGANLAALGASTTARGIVELATDAETITGTDTARAVTPAGGAAAYQPLDADLTAIAALSTTTFGRSFLAASSREAFLDLLDIDSDGTVSIADDQVGAIASLPASVTGFLFVGANTANDASIFAIDTTAANSIVTKVLGPGCENGGVGTPSPAAGTDGSYGVYVGTDDIVRISNRRGATLTFGCIFLGVRF